MAITIENLEKAFDEMFDFITDLPSGLDGFESDFDAAFEELKELKSALTPPNEWVSVEERLPDNAKEVLVSLDNGCVTISVRFSDDSWYVSEKRSVTHWMPLPAPPEKEE